jgi:hypothetical protein
MVRRGHVEPNSRTWKAQRTLVAKFVVVSDAVAQRTTLSEKQVELLRWIAKGCRDGVMEGDSYRISAAALRNRGLIRTSGHGQAWKAKIAPAGVEYLQRVDGPAPPIARQANVSVTQQLIDDVAAAGGCLRRPARRWGATEGIDWEQRARLAQIHGKVPSGMRLRTERIDGEIEIRLVDGIPGTEVPLQPLPVPRRVARLHTVARKFRDDTAGHLVSRAQLPRCVRIVHALATEAERRGWDVDSVVGAVGRRTSRGMEGEAGHFVISIREHSYRLTVVEEKVVLRGAFDAETEYRRAVNYPAYLRPRARTRYDADATGRLQLTCAGCSREGRPSTWADRRSWTLEDKLPNVLQELEIRAAEDDHAEVERQRRAEERQRQWQAAMDRARHRFIENHRLELLRARIHSWNEAEAIRDYCEAVELRHGVDAVDGEVAEWLEFARVQADRAQDLPRMPADPDITPEALKPYLKGWSPYGPDGW